jgi:carboxylesterase type B
MLIIRDSWKFLRYQNNIRMISNYVKVSQGTVKGVEESLPNGNKFMRFSGVPYAKPPVNELRFQPPQKLIKFNQSELDCTKERDACFHKSTIDGKYIGSEDCLNLNIYVPQKVNAEKLTVMVYIHGGSFI